MSRFQFRCIKAALLLLALALAALCALFTPADRSAGAAEPLRQVTLPVLLIR